MMAMFPPPGPKKKPEPKKKGVRLTPILFFLFSIMCAILLHQHLSSPPAVEKETFMQKYGNLAIVTGAARGIGREFAWQLASLGMDLILVSRRSDTLSVTAAEIEAKFGVTVTQVVAEFGTDGAEEKVIKACEGKQVDLYVGNHAGTNVIGDQGDAKPWIKQPLDFHLKLTDITYISQIKLTHYFATKMADRRRGGIIIVSTIASTKVAPFYAMYSSAKAGLSSLALALWFELRPYGVDIVRAHVGATDTPASRKAFTEEGFKSLPGSIQSPAEVVDEVLRGLGRQHTVVPGLSNKLAEMFLGFLPHHIVGMLMHSTAKGHMHTDDSK